MATDDTKGPRARPGYWPLAAGFAVSYFVVMLGVGPLVDLLFGDPVRFLPKPGQNAFVAVFFGLTMSWWTRRRSVRG